MGGIEERGWEWPFTLGDARVLVGQEPGSEGSSYFPGHIE